MNEDWSGAFIAKPVVDRGMSAWSTTAEEVGKSLPKLAADVEAHLSTAPWGDGTEGMAFYRAHLAEGGPYEMINQCKRLAEQVVDAGDRLRAAIDNTLETDADIRDGLTRMTREV
ncbi:hypothetical protein AB0K18_23935 [Nonomuraea sp. NPDC049421]|uniref:hypothetical protein n=1 Tax=Nonomuraea sp. NPDC049421 TaxID=3155275 RepID=UPI0034139C4F